MLSRLAYAIPVLLIGILLIVASRLPQVQILEAVAFEVLGPVQDSVSIPVVHLDRIGQTVERISQLEAENARLRAEVERLSREAVLVPELQRENAELRAELSFQHEHPEFRLLSARIIGFDPSNLVHAIIIDRGTRHGVAEGMTVITPSGLVGQVVQVSPTTAKVLLITDVSSSVYGVVQSSRARGVVNGSRSGDLTMTFIPQNLKVQPGDRVVTSGLGGVFPPGLWIGTVTAVRQNDVDLYQEAKVQPAVDLSRVEEVLVIINHLPSKLG